MKMNADLLQTISTLRQDMQVMEQRLRHESGLEMDRRIETSVKLAAKDAGMKNLMSDPRNKGIEHFSGCKAEDVKLFKVWRTKMCNYLERFIPGIEDVLTKYVFTDESLEDIVDAHTGTWDDRYTEPVLRKEMKIFLTDHLDIGAAEIIESDHAD